MEDDLITTKEVGDYRIKVYYCRDSECPITNWGLFGSFFFEYSDTHRLHDEWAHKAKMLKKRAEICERYDKKIRQAEAEKKIILCVFDYGLSTDNVIYYSHTNTLSFNWGSYEKKITQEEFDDFVKNVDRSKLPEGIKFELK